MKDFKQLNLIAPLERALSEAGYHTPTSIQAKALPAALDGHDILGCAQTGTGKTAAFALPVLDWLGAERISAQPKRPLALCLAPTRELAIQIGDSFRKYGKHLRLRVSLAYGGVSQRNQVRDLERGAQVLVATPGRLLDLMSQGRVKLDDLEIFVLDEADRMLDMGFLPDLKRIINQLPEERQSMFFSATMPPKIRALAKQLLWKPVTVDVTPKVAAVEAIDQRVMLVNRGEKQQILRRLLAAPDVDRAIVFTKTKRGANRLSEKLQRHGVASTAIHGNKSQTARQNALNDFRDARIRVLVATDVAARGIDVHGITHVVNYDIPNDPESYVHRIGRTGRSGASGIAVSLCSPDESGDLRAIEGLLGKRVPIAKQPTSDHDSNGEAAGHGRRPGRPSRTKKNGRRRRKPARQADKS